MIYFAPAKINLGLQIIERRKDGFHNLCSVMYPLPLSDILEVCQLPGQEFPVRFTQSGIPAGDRPEKNLCMQAWELFSSEYPLPPVAIHLHKQIPVGAGLGGGSSDASAVLSALNALADYPAGTAKLADLAGQLGSDCPFFLQKEPRMMEGRGELLSPVNISLDGCYLILLFPEIHISTAEAYAAVSPGKPEEHLRQLVETPLATWKDSVINDFEQAAFEKHPLLHTIKHALYQEGAQYASMSGSGSALYGIFTARPKLPREIREYVIWEGAV